MRTVINGIIGTIVGCILNYAIVQTTCGLINCFVSKDKQYDEEMVGIIFIIICTIVGLIIGFLCDSEALNKKRKAQEKQEQLNRNFEGSIEADELAEQAIL